MVQCLQKRNCPVFLDHFQQVYICHINRVPTLLHPRIPRVFKDPKLLPSSYVESPDNKCTYQTVNVIYIVIKQQWLLLTYTLNQKGQNYCHRNHGKPFFICLIRNYLQINQSIKTLIHVDRPQRDKVHMVKIKSTMIHNNNNLNLNM